MTQTPFTQKPVTVTWLDAVQYSSHEDIPSKLTTVTTQGIVTRETPDYIFIKNPTTPTSAGHHPRFPREAKNDQPTFLYLPKALIQSITTNHE